MAISLGRLIRLLECEPPDNTVRFDFGGFIPRKVNSYRGYYDHLAIGYDEDYSNQPVVRDLLAELRSAIGKTFQGYKGGDYRMDERTPVWVGNYGHCSNTAIVGIADCNWTTVFQTAWED